MLTSLLREEEAALSRESRQLERAGRQLLRRLAALAGTEVDYCLLPVLAPLGRGTDEEQ